MFRSLDFRSRSRFRRIVYSKPMALLLFALLVLLTQATWGMYEKSVEAREKRDQARVDLDKVLERESLLSNDIERLSSDRGVEEEIRSRFMVAKEGENVIIVRDPEAESNTRSIIVPVEERSFTQKLLGAVGFLGE